MNQFSHTKNEVNIMLCCSDKCEKFQFCARAVINQTSSSRCEDVENLLSFGQGGSNMNTVAWCGKAGNYKMFIPIDEKCKTL